MARWNWSLMVLAMLLWMILVLRAPHTSAPVALPTVIVSQGMRGLIFAIIYRSRGGGIGSPWRPDPFPSSPRWVYGFFGLLVLAGLVLSFPAMDWPGWKNRSGYLLLFTGIIWVFVASPIGLLFRRLRTATTKRPLA